MTWDDLSDQISRLSAVDRAKPVEVLNPFYRRLFTVTAIDHEQSYLNGKQVANDRLVLIVYDGK